MNNFSIRPIQFKDLQDVLEKCGGVVVKEIIRCVNSRIQPDGSGQKQNAPSTIARKKHDHPVIENRARFTKPGTYKVAPRDSMSVMITIANPDDSSIAAHLEDKGYNFFGITPQAEDRAFQFMDVYLQEQVQEAFRK